MDEDPEYLPDDDLEHASADAGDAGCPACGSTRVTFRVARSIGLSTPLSQRSLVWECRDCKTRWAERLVAFLNPDPTQETLDAPWSSPPHGRPRTPPDSI